MLFYEPGARDLGLLPHDPRKALVAPRPIARCGYLDEYAAVTELFTMTRPDA